VYLLVFHAYFTGDFNLKGSLRNAYISRSALKGELGVAGNTTDHDNTAQMTKITVDLVNLVTAEQNNQHFKHRVLQTGCS
jgi:hypothetical protein